MSIATQVCETLSYENRRSNLTLEKGTAPLVTAEITDQSPLSEYIPHKVADRSEKDKNFKYENLHWGQRKLLNSEIDFLTNHTDSKTNYICVYAGAADGQHMPYLSSLFKNISFHLYDPAKFHPSVLECQNLFINPYKSD